jgi:type I restriction enzyme S subunit
MPNKMLPEGWNKLTLDECIDSDRLPKKPSIPQRDYQPLGKYPVVDQGAELIAGYCDVDTAVYRDHLPLILFGDHTRIFKFLDFPFATGADGTKLLKPNSHIVEPLFLYYALRNIDLPSRGYNRHFRILREQVIRAPTDRDEQKRIAWFLKTIEDSVEVESAICDKLAALKSATMAKLFREGLRGEPLKQTEIGEIPESWEVKPVSAVSDAVSGGTPSKQRTDWWSGSIPWASPKDMKKLRLRDTEDHITPEAAEAGSRIVPPKTVFIVVRGMVLAKDVPVAITEAPMAFNQDMKALLPSERINPDFLLYALCARKSALIQEIGTSAHGTRRMSGSSVDGLLIPVPKDPGEQRDIAETLHMLDRREEISKERVRCLQSLFSSTLHALMTGAIRVKDLDLAEVGHA